MALLAPAAKGDLLDDRQRDLLDAEQRFHGAFLQRVEALKRIHDDKLFETFGFDKFIDYCKVRLEISKSSAFRLLEVANIVAELKDGSPLRARIVSEAPVRVLAGMPQDRVLKVLEVACAVAEREDRPLSGALVVKVARANFKWKTHREFVADQRAKKLAADPAAATEAFKKRAAKLFEQLLDLGNPETLVEVHGSALGWASFEALYDWLQRLREVS